jgi:hypothetical protein
MMNPSFESTRVAVLEHLASTKSHARTVRSISARVGIKRKLVRAAIYSLAASKAVQVRLRNPANVRRLRPVFSLPPTVDSPVCRVDVPEHAPEENAETASDGSDGSWCIEG